MSKRLEYSYLPSNRLMYDKSQYASKMKEFENYQDLILNPEPMLDNITCLNLAYGSKINPRISENVDTESELLNLTRNASKDPMEQFPFKQMPIKQTQLTNCNRVPSLFNSSRINQTENNLTIGIDQINQPILISNPQDPRKISSNTRGGINTRLFSRDTYDLNNKNK